MKQQINDDIEEINKKLRTELSTSSVNINTYIKKREELLNLKNKINDPPVQTFLCSSIPLPLHPHHGGTGVSVLGIFPVSLGGTGHSYIPKNGILIGNDKNKPSVQIINGSIISSNSPQILLNKIIDANCNSLININLSQGSFINTLSMSNGGTNKSSLIANSILIGTGTSEFIEHELIKTVSFMAFNNGTTQSITQSLKTIVNWTISYDTTNSFNPNTGIYTVPYDGYYSFSWSVGYNSNSAGVPMYNNFIKTYCVTPCENFESVKIIPWNSNNSLITTDGSNIICLKKNDTVYLQTAINLLTGNPQTMGNSNLTWFNCILLRNI